MAWTPQQPWQPDRSWKPRGAGGVVEDAQDGAEPAAPEVDVEPSTPDGDPQPAAPAAEAGVDDRLDARWATQAATQGPPGDELPAGGDEAGTGQAAWEADDADVDGGDPPASDWLPRPSTRDEWSTRTQPSYRTRTASTRTTSSRRGWIWLVVGIAVYAFVKANTA